MSNSSHAGRNHVFAVLSVATFAAALALAMPQASAASCQVIADQLSHQNAPVRDAAVRLTSCARKYVRHADTLSSKSKSEWQRLCDGDKATYTSLLNYRQRILVNCRPRGSDG